MAKFLVNRINRTLTLYIHQAVNFLLNTLFCLCELRQVGRKARPDILISQVVLNGVRQHEVAVGKSLHQCRCTQTVVALAVNVVEEIA